MALLHKDDSTNLNHDEWINLKKNRQSWNWKSINQIVSEWKRSKLARKFSTDEKKFHHNYNIKWDTFHWNYEGEEIHLTSTDQIIDTAKNFLKMQIPYLINWNFFFLTHSKRQKIDSMLRSRSKEKNFILSAKNKNFQFH